MANTPSFRPRDRAPKTDKETVGIGEWMLTIPFMMIPILNIFIAALLGYIDRTSETKKNFYIAVIIYSTLLVFFL